LIFGGVGDIAPRRARQLGQEERMERPRMVFATDDGNIWDHPELEMCGTDGGVFRPVEPSELIELPRGSDLFTLPGRSPVGIDPDTGEQVAVGDFEGEAVHGVAAFMAPAYTQILRPAFVPRPGAPALPLYAYTSLGFADDRFWVAGLRVDPDQRQDPYRFDRKKIEKQVQIRTAEMPGNPVVGQLVRCALEYGCRAAQNYFLARWEAPLPVSVACNAQCLGCISLQPGSADFKAAHDRLSKAPRPEHVAELALGHIERVAAAVVSFGQGCEGEPLLLGDVLVDSTRMIRSRTAAGTINLNTNGSKPDVVARLCEAGLDAIRVSMNSPRPDLYRAYYNPRGYDIDAVVESLQVVRRAGGWRGINLFVFPGVTDTAAELDALSALIEGVDLEMIQLRNLNIDPDVYMAKMPIGSVQEGLGVPEFMAELRRRHPHLRYGYFNPPKERFGAWRAERAAS
jgi:molybdenum cofactor biosynthesis enzyme MoaA